MQCQACGTNLPADSQFCPQCGARAGDARAGSPPRPPTPPEKLREAGRREDAEEPEQALWSGGFSAKAMIGSWLLGAAATIGVVAVGALFLPVALVAVPLIWLVLLLILAYRKLFVRYELTNQRFIHRTGILKRVTDRIEVIDIDDVTCEQGIVQRLLGVGTIKISSSDRTHPQLALQGIDDVKHIADTIDEVRRKERRRRGLHIETI
jgi:uncharacterized membrane protein YdbT with pleckstrin-like domain